MYVSNLKIIYLYIYHFIRKEFNRLNPKHMEIIRQKKKNKYFFVSYVKKNCLKSCLERKLYL